MTRIAVGGFLHETNTFAPTKAVYDAFVRGGGWPPMSHGARLLERMRDINVGMAGFVPAAEAEGWELVPTIWCAASPSAHVTEDAYERVAKTIVDGIKAAGSIDGVYLDLHGAMVAEHLDDGEGEILARVREAIGKDLPLVVSLDLHANVTPEMVEHADALIAYRTYPHVDMADTGRAAARHLALLLGTGQKFAKAFRQLPFLIPISWQCTNDQPTKASTRNWPRFRATRCRRCRSRRAFRRRISLIAARPYSPMAEPRPTPTPRRTASPRWSLATKTISTAASTRPTKACATRWSWPGAQANQSSSPTPRTIPAPAAIPTPRGCCARWSGTAPPRPRSA
jgi:Uncharacterized conserved protein